MSQGDRLGRIATGLRMLTVPFPYLAGLAAATRVELDPRVPTMGVFASGRLVANAQFVDKLNDADMVFVLAHELLHLALRTHDRARGSDPLQFNYAHDYIINDILRAELGRDSIPAGGLDMPGARKKSAEEILLDLKRKEGRPEPRADSLDADVLDDGLEREWFPTDRAAQAEADRKMRELAARGLGLARAMGALKGVRGLDPGGEERVVEALRGIYRPRWEQALQRWLESVAPAERTFVRPSRRGEPAADVVLAGRRRAGWMLNVLLDSSGSMAEVIPRALGAVGGFCEAALVDQVRLLQCDAGVTADDTVEPDQLARYRVAGFGGSDLTPAFVHLGRDPAVRAALVITDGDIAYPAEPAPFEVLWVLPQSNPAFRPAYGRVLVMES